MLANTAELRTGDRVGRNEWKDTNQCWYTIGHIDAIATHSPVLVRAPYDLMGGSVLATFGVMIIASKQE